MICLVLGTPDSGKSAKAESIVMDISGQDKRYYIATMVPFGEEGKKRVEKHRKMREGKGFETIECPARVHELISKLPNLKDSTCLLECMSNLIGNEMHEPKKSDSRKIAEVETNKVNEGNNKKNAVEEDRGLCDKIIDSVMMLAGNVRNLVIVSNRFSLEAEGYDEDTRRYVALVDMVNKELKKRVDEVYELI